MGNRHSFMVKTAIKLRDNVRNLFVPRKAAFPHERMPGGPFRIGTDEDIKRDHKRPALFTKITDLLIRTTLKVKGNRKMTLDDKTFGAELLLVEGDGNDEVRSAYASHNVYKGCRLLSIELFKQALLKSWGAELKNAREWLIAYSNPWWGAETLAIRTDKELWVACLDLRVRGSKVINFRVIRAQAEKEDLKGQAIVSDTEDDLGSDEESEEESDEEDSSSMDTSD